MELSLLRILYLTQIDLLDTNQKFDQMSYWKNQRITFVFLTMFADTQ